MNYKYRAYDSAVSARANQRQIMDMLNDGAKIQVSHCGRKHWVDGEVYFEQGDDAFPELQPGELSPQQVKTRDRILLPYSIWGTVIGLLAAATSGSHADKWIVPILAFVWLLSIAWMWKGKRWAWIYGLLIMGLIQGMMLYAIRLADLMDILDFGLSGGVIGFGFLLLTISLLIPPAVFITLFLMKRKVLVNPNVVD
ncbi:MAG: hypothetical protein AAF492_00275 [Verrucomicrobiota bacterium]